MLLITQNLRNQASSTRNLRLHKSIDQLRRIEPELFPLSLYARNFRLLYIYWSVYTLVAFLLITRFIILGFGLENWFTAFIIVISSALVLPFSSFLEYSGTSFGLKKFDFESVFAILLYTFIAIKSQKYLQYYKHYLLEKLKNNSKSYN